MAYLTGEARAQLDAFKAVTVKHVRLQEVDAALSLAIEEHADSTHVLVRSQVKAVLIDEGHRLMQGGGRYTTDEQLEWLKSLTNRTNVLHVLAGPYELFRFRNTRGQLARRGRDLHFARYHVERADERKEFVAAVKYLLERVPLSCDLNALLRRWRWFAEGSVGCIGNLKTWLVDAVAATLAEGGPRFTEAMRTRTRPHPAKRG